MLLIFLALACSVSKNSDAETENLRKEVENLRKERDEKANKEANSNENKASNENANTEVKKNSPTPTPKPKVSAPVGSTVAYCNSNNVVVRSSPSLNASKVNSLKKGEKVFVIEESDNYDEWKGTEANWAYIQKENGERGWVFTPFISYD